MSENGNGTPEKKNRRGVVPEGEKCKGWSKQKDAPCSQRRKPGSEYCHYHGGANRKGIAHPNFKHGRHSQVIPPVHLREKWDAFLGDEELLHHRNAVAIHDSMIQEVFDHYEEGGTPGFWKRLYDVWERYTIAGAAKDRYKGAEALAELGIVIDGGRAQTNREKQIVELYEARRKHADSQLKRETAERNVWTYEEASAFYVALGAAVRRHCTEDQIVAIERDLSAIAATRGVPHGEDRTPGPTGNRDQARPPQ